MLTLIHPVPPHGDLLPVRAQRRLLECTHYYTAVPLDRHLRNWLQHATPISKDEVNEHGRVVVLGDPSVYADEWIPALTRAHVEAVEHGHYPMAIGETTFPDPWLDLKVPTVLKTQHLEEAGYVGPQTPLTDGILLEASRKLPKERILVPREDLADLLEQHGAEALYLPLLGLVPLDFEEPEPHEWVLFTSANAVRHYVKDARKLPKIAAIGPATAQALRDLNLPPDLVADEASQEGLLEKLPRMESALIPRAEEAREVLPDELRKRGTKVTVLPVYRTEKAPQEEVPEADLIFFTSSSTVRHFRELTEEDIPVIAIGPSTAETAKQLGFTDVTTAPVHTLDGMVSCWRASRSPRSSAEGK